MTPPVMRRAQVMVAETGRPVAAARVADTSWTRMVGLLRDRALAPGDGMIIKPCSMIHTYFMRFPIDVLFLDRNHTIVHIAHRVDPFRFAWGGWRSSFVIELPAGQAEQIGIAPGERLAIGEPT